MHGCDTDLKLPLATAGSREVRRARGGVALRAEGQIHTYRLERLVREG